MQSFSLKILRIIKFVFKLNFYDGDFFFKIEQSQMIKTNIVIEKQWITKLKNKMNQQLNGVYFIWNYVFL